MAEDIGGLVQEKASVGCVDLTDVLVEAGKTHEFLSHGYPGYLDECLVVSPSTDFSVVVTIDDKEFFNKTYAEYCNITQVLRCISAFEERDEDGNPLGNYIVHIKNLAFKESIVISVRNNGGSPVTFHNLLAKYKGGE
ncbi:hypothetical protein ES702_02455 [subsurface metagenome]